LDEPDLRQDYSTAMLKRLTLGVDVGEYLRDYGVEGSLIAEDYSNDWRVLKLSYERLYSSGNVPESSNETNVRKNPMRVAGLRSANEITGDIIDYLRIDAGAGQYAYVGVRKENTFSQYLMEELRSAQFRAQHMDQILDHKAAIGEALQNILAAVPEGAGVRTVDEFKIFGKAVTAEVEKAGTDSVISQLIQNIFGLELRVYNSVFSRLEQDVQALRARVAEMESQLSSGKDENGVVLTEERKLLIAQDIAAIKNQIGIKDTGIAIQDYKKFMSFVEQRKLLGGSLPAIQPLQREPIVARFEQTTRKGAALELDAKVTLLTEALLTSLRIP
jgi:hypothetical protein